MRDDNKDIAGPLDIYQQSSLVAEHARKQGVYGKVDVDLTQKGGSALQHYWADYHDPADPPEGHVIVPLWPIQPAGMRQYRSKRDRFKPVWKGGQYVSGPIDQKTGLAGVGVPIRVRSYAYAKQLCEPDDGSPQLAEWPDKMGIKSIAPVYRKNTVFNNENRWK